MKLLVVALVCIQLIDAKKRGRGGYIVGGVSSADDDIGKGMVYVEVNGGYCSGVCISKRVVLTCGKCALTGTVKLKVGVGKQTEDGGGMQKARYTKDGEIAMIITKEDMTTCKPLKIACAKKHLPTAGEYTTIYGWGMTALTPTETVPDKVQMADMKWATNDAACASTYTGNNQLTTGAVKYICMEPNKSPQATQTSCFGDCGGPAIKEGRVVGLIIRSPGNCAVGSPTVVASIVPQLAQLLSSTGVGKFMLDDYAASTVDQGSPTTAVALPYTVMVTECKALVNLRIIPDKTTPGDCKGAETTKDYGTVKKGAPCDKQAQQMPGIVYRKPTIKCNAKKLAKANGCKCCNKAKVAFRCLKCE